jgi:hypothetical protein
VTGASGSTAAGAPAASGGAGSATGTAGSGTPEPADAGAPDAATDAGGAPEARFMSRAVAAPPSYMGSVDNGADCSRSYATLGFEPVETTGARHPLFLYFVGTQFLPDDPSSRHDSAAARAVTEAMARRGYVALSVQYDNGALAWLSDHENQLRCLFGADGATLLAAACALPQVDCDLGIATWGHSQGAFIGVRASAYDARVRAMWATGYGDDPGAMIEPRRLRVVNGEADTTNGQAALLNQITRQTPAECPETLDQCLRADGSGWIIVRRAELADPASASADHCWFDRSSCASPTIALEPNWVAPDSDKPFALELNADWVARTGRLLALPAP